jgi:hypothetical protein
MSPPEKPHDAPAEQAGAAAGDEARSAKGAAPAAGHGGAHGGGHEQAEEAGESVGIWYVSFADMITLLLAFFVMLSAFSSYDNKSIEMIQEASAYARSYPHTLSVWDATGGQSVVTPVNESRMPTAGTQQTAVSAATIPPPEEPLGSALAYKDRKVIAIAADALFLGRTACLSQDGKRDLDLLVTYLRARPPGRVHISCSPPPEGDEASVEAETKSRLARQWVVAGVLHGQGRVPMDRIALSAGGGGDDGGSSQPRIVVTLLSKETDR